MSTSCRLESCSKLARHNYSHYPVIYCTLGVRVIQAKQRASERMLVCGRDGRKQPEQSRGFRQEAQHGGYALHVRAARQRFDGGQCILRQPQCERAAVGHTLGPFELTRHHWEQSKIFAVDIFKSFEIVQSLDHVYTCFLLSLMLLLNFVFFPCPMRVLS